MGPLHTNRCYSKVIQSTKQGKKSNLGNKLNLMIDNDGLLRCNGRYDNVNLTESVKYPKLLHKSEHYTRLVIEDYHSKLLQSGVSQTLACTRREYWIPHGRSQVKKILNQCRVCHHNEGNPLRFPECLLGIQRELMKLCPSSILGSITLGLCTLNITVMLQTTKQNQG